ncbi:MAG: acylphosphatase [Cyclobacteriaceae bacterium]|nr:acylphosphatase [Cyclobacteriaceae bacterium]
MNAKTVKIEVFGKVQGVFYRASTKEKAIELGLTGKVKNMNDGSVYIEATGNREKLNELLEWCHTGPKFADVTSVHNEWIEEPSNYDDFRIEY